MEKLKSIMNKGAMSRLNLILVAVLVLQVGLSAIVLWPKSGQVGEAPLAMPDLVAADVQRLTITDAQGQTIALAQQTGQWVLPEADDYPVQADKVTALVEKLAQIKLDSSVTRTAASHAQLKLAEDDFERRIIVETADKDTTLYLGSSPAYGSTHFRLGVKDEAFLTSALTVYDAATQASQYIDTAYVNVPLADVTAMTLQNLEGEFTLTRVDESTWTMGEGPVGVEIDQTKATSLVQRAASIRMDMPLGRTMQPSWGLAAPQATVTLQTAEGETVLEIGASIEGGYACKSSDSAYAVRIASYYGDDLVQQQASELWVPTPEPTPNQ